MQNIGNNQSITKLYYTSNFIKAMSPLVKVSDWNSFQTNQIYFELFRNLSQANSNPSQSIRKKLWIWCKSVKNQSVSIRVDPTFLILIKIQSDLIRLNPRLAIRINPKKYLNSNESEVRMIQTEFLIRINPNNSDLGFVRISKIVLNHSDSKSRINSD